jgi:flagellar biosynthesis component FlhA
MEIGVKVMGTEKNRFNKLQQEQRDLDESYQQSKRNKKERENYSNPVAAAVRTSKYKSQVIKNKKKEDYFERKSVKQLLEEMDQDELKKIEDRNGF